MIWPRLFRLLPPDVQAALDDEVNQLDVSVRLTVTWAIAAVVGSFILLHHPTQLWSNPLWALLVLGLWLLSRVTYLSAVESAIAHGVDVEVAVDLYRGKVVDAVRIAQPATLSQERRIFRRLCVLFQTHGSTDEELVFRTDIGGGISGG